MSDENIRQVYFSKREGDCGITAVLPTMIPELFNSHIPFKKKLSLLLPLLQQRHHIPITSQERSTGHSEEVKSNLLSVNVETFKHLLSYSQK